MEEETSSDLAITRSDTFTANSSDVHRLGAPVPEFVYLCQPTDFVGTDVYKPGRTSGDKLRMSAYGKDRNELQMNHVTDSVRTEAMILAAFNEHFECVQGVEYFRGDYKKMRDVYLQTILEAERTLPVVVPVRAAIVITTDKFVEDIEKILPTIIDWASKSRPLPFTKSISGIYTVFDYRGNKRLRNTCPFCHGSYANHNQVVHGHMDFIANCETRPYSLQDEDCSCPICSCLFKQRLDRAKHLLYGLCAPFRLGYVPPPDIPRERNPQSRMILRADFDHQVNIALQSFPDDQPVFLGKGIVYTIGALRKQFINPERRKYFDALKMSFNANGAMQYLA